VQLKHKTTLIRAGEPLKYVYFPDSGVLSMVIRLLNGTTIEAGMIGRDSVFGAVAALDGGIAINDAIVQLPGTATVLTVPQLRKAADESSTFRTTLIRHEQALLAQALQSAACNGSHTVEARMSRWLLRAHDLSGGDDLPLTQEFLAQMLAVERSRVSLVASTLQHAGLIRYSRGHIILIDIPGLKESACECYATTKAVYEALLGVHSGAGTRWKARRGDGEEAQDPRSRGNLSG
jgi:CRP-like cAMP-binding protein